MTGPLPARLEAPAKLTRSLRVRGRRSDGYHLLEAEMVSLDWGDSVTLEPGAGLEVVDLTPGGRGGDLGPPEDNLVHRALELVGAAARVRLEKRVPPGAGLGGGSADAAAVLRWAGMSPDPDGLARAARLGADVPFCLLGGRARVGGIGEVVEPLAHLAIDITLLILPFGMSTPAVYRRWDALAEQAGSPSPPGWADGPGSSAEPGVNDLTDAAVAEDPRLARWRDALGQATGMEPRLAGSGSTWFVERAFADLAGPFVPPGADPGLAPGLVVVTRTAERHP